MLPGLFQAGTELTAAALASAGPLAAVKYSDFNVGPSNTALQADPDLNLTLAAAGTYAGLGMIIYTSSATADYQAAITVPSGATGGWNPNPYIGSGGSAYVTPGAMISFGSGNTIAAGGQGTASYQVFMIQYSVIMGAVAGNLQWLAAQNTTDATNTNTRAGSYLLAWRIA